MSKLMLLCFTAAATQAVLGLWLIHEGQTASDGDLEQCQAPLVTDPQGRSPLQPRAFN
jgi:hypothetical protein